MEAHVGAPAEAGREQSDGAPGPQDLRQWLALIEAAGELCRVRGPVNLDEEVGAVTYMATRREGAPALLFEQFRGYSGDVRVLSNLLGSSRRRYALAVGLDPDLSVPAMIVATRQRLRRRIEPVAVDPAAAPVNHRVLTGADIDLTALPVPRYWPQDGGRYIGTADVTLTRDRDSGRVNVGVYRQMLHGPRRVGLYCSPGKHGLLDREGWWRRGEPCPVVVAYGIDPVLFMIGAQTFAAAESELAAAGGLSGAPVAVTRGVATDLPLPARAEVVIEGVLHPGATEPEGPLGEFTGYYGNPRSPQPVIEVQALHLREAPILTAALMADYPSCEIGMYYAIMRSARIWDDLDRLGVPGIRGVFCFPNAASGWGMVAVSLQQRYAGHAAQVLSLVAQCPAAAYFTKWIIAVDEDVDPTDLNQVLWALSTRCNPVEDVDFQRDTWSTKLDPSRGLPENRPYGSKALINACKNHRHLQHFPDRMLLRRSVYQQVADRWEELGLPGAAPTLTALAEE